MERRFRLARAIKNHPIRALSAASLLFGVAERGRIFADTKPALSAPAATGCLEDQLPMAGKEIDAVAKSLNKSGDVVVFGISEKKLLNNGIRIIKHRKFDWIGADNDPVAAQSHFIPVEAALRNYPNIQSTVDSLRWLINYDVNDRPGSYHLPWPSYYFGEKSDAQTIKTFINTEINKKSKTAVKKINNDNFTYSDASGCTDQP